MSSIVCRAQSNRIEFVVPIGRSIRDLEAALTQVGVEFHADRSRRHVSVPLAEGARLHELVRAQGFELDKSAAMLFTNWERDESLLIEKRRILQQLQLPGTAQQVLSDFPECGLLDLHQIQAVAIASHPLVTGLCLFDEQGLGKTVQTLFSYHRMRSMGRIGKMVVFAPKNMLSEWVRDCERFFGDTYKIRIVSGLEREKRRQLGEHSDIFVTNFESALSLGIKLKHLLQNDRNGTLLVVDESFFVKNPGAKRAKAVIALRPYAKRCLVLCGTPAPNSPHDLVHQFNIADGGIAFKDVHIPEGRDEARPVIQTILDTRAVFLRRLKDHVLTELPGRTFNTVLVPIEPIQATAYRAALEGLVDELKATTEASFRKQLTSFMARRTALLQICSNPGSLLNGYVEIPSKLVALDSILAELIERRREKVIIWSYYRYSLSTIVSRYARYNPVRLDGMVSEITARREAITKFQTNETTMLMVANPAAAGAGITLHRARFAIYESMSNQAAHYLQSLDRVHRRGQTREVEYIILLCDRTIELSEFDRLRRKEAAAKQLLKDDSSQPFTKELLLQELLTSAKSLGLNRNEKR